MVERSHYFPLSKNVYCRAIIVTPYLFCRFITKKYRFCFNKRIAIKE